MTSSTVLSVRVSSDLKDQLDFLAKATRRSKAFIAAEALEQYVARNAWKAKELQAAIEEADKGVFISHERMKRWAKELAENGEAEAPEPDIFLKRK